ncbi:RmlC-like cupin domain-containing protein [Durotheca rogersii]|uniref:RmlC-like cupin domain-containing protein n=1 Tax=Durotheca rogersii TaxID=419775 RepID=UPI002220B296|nr:RmlC-like cupin domain-containing protein [Durotheca rogersii]KAI5867931.1 RmlC-like cupin domain-containing protein [Durotheca rogersii]
MHLSSALLLGLGPAGLLATAATRAAAADGVPIGERSAQEVVAQLNLVPNSEKGYYVQSFEDGDRVIRTSPCGAVPAGPSATATRSASTAIYYLLEGADGDSIWHRVDAAEVWHYYAGAPLTLSLSRDDGLPYNVTVLGPDIFAGQIPQLAIPKHVWQSARSLGNWTLVGTTVAPGFVFEGVELAPPDWTPRGP